MGAQLKATDILDEMKDDTEKVSPKKAIKKPSAKMGAKERLELAEEYGRGKASPFLSDLREKLRHQAQFSFGNLPEFVVEGFAKRAKEMGMNKREYLYHLLREDGVAIPPYKLMDGRKL